MLAHRASLFVLLLPLALLATARPAGAQPADQAAIDRAVEQGVQFLKRTQSGSSWGAGTGPGAGKGWGIGYTSLVGLALAESGVPASDPALRKAAKLVRDNAYELDDTYEVALAILFLDRMKDKSDRTRIQVLAGRLIAAQAASGGWGYKVAKHAPAEAVQLLDSLRRMSPPPPPVYPSVRERPPGLGLCIKAGDDIRPRPPAPFDATKARGAAVAALPAGLKRLPVLSDSANLPDDPKDKRNELADATTDNSNTHFAMLGLWAARRHEVPTDRTFALVAKRFRTSQGPGGTWAYDFARTGADGPGATTCIALLGVAIGHVVSPDPNVRPERDPQVLNAFAALSKSIGEPAGTTANRPKVKDVGGLYFLWTMERIAVLYDLRSLNKKDWYQWGAEILLGDQLADGSWGDGGPHIQHPALSTALALLFLRRANLTPDLARRLVVDTAALTAKVDDRVTPKPEPPAPKVEPPPPTPKVEEPPKVEPKAEPPAPTSKPPEPQPAATPTPAKKTPWLWIMLGMVLAGVVGGGLAFVVAKRMKKNDEEEKPKKKKGKKKPKVEEDEEE